MGRKPEEALPESDRFLNFCLPRENPHFIGHELAENELLEAFRSGHLPQAFLIGGLKGVGKATLAWRFVRFLLLHKDPSALVASDPKNLFVPPEHPLFRQTASLAHGDIFLLRREWNEKTNSFFTDIRVDDVRRATHMFQQSSSAGGYRACIVDSADDLNPSSANALLKLIEEPPPRALFLIIAHRPGQVMATIRSRCRKLTLKPLSDETIGKIIQLPELGVEAAGTNLKQALLRANGSVRSVLALLDAKALSFDAALNLMLEALPHLDYATVHRLADQTAGRDHEAEFEIMVSQVNDWLSLRLRAMEHASPQQLAPFAEVWEKLARDARDCETYNLDKRPLVLALFRDLALAVQMAKARI